LLGVVLALQKAEVHITDRIETATQLITKNLKLNNSSAKVSILDWNKLNEFKEETHFDIIVGSDVLYQSRNAEAINLILSSDFLQTGGIGIIFCPGRGYAERLERLMNAQEGFHSEAFYLQDVKLSTNMIMPELHIVFIEQKNGMINRLHEIKEALFEFISRHSNGVKMQI
jgi:predicted nicotinamide N-methyase